MNRKTRFLTIAGIAFALLIFVNTATAAKPEGNLRPGWGYGDNNHVHTGPPGQSVRPSNNTFSYNIQVSSNTGGNVSEGGGSINSGVTRIVIIISNFIGNIF